MANRSKKLSEHQKQIAEEQIAEANTQVKFNITEYTVEFLASKVKSGEYYVPEYQRELTWDDKRKSRFIESVLIGLPIPFLFFWQHDDGRFEIVDGSQRLRTLHEFLEDEHVLSKLELLPYSNSFVFSDFSDSRRRKFNSRSIRGIVLDTETSVATRTEMFNRINTGGSAAKEAEIRRGALPGPVTSLIIELAKDDHFSQLTPISKRLVNLREREELVARFFTYLENLEVTPDGLDLPGYKDRPREFIFGYLQRANGDENLDAKGVDKLRTKFLHTIEFVTRVFPHGFVKGQGLKQVPRARFEAIAIGVALALQKRPALLEQDVSVNDWINGDGFRIATTSGGANVKSKLIGRISFVRDKLLEE